MAVDIKQAFSKLTTKQKAMAGVFALIVIIVIWQGATMFGGGGSGSGLTPPPIVSSAPTPMTGNMPGAPGSMAAQQPLAPPKVQSAVLLKESPEKSERELELIKMQQETQFRYLATLNELSNLKMSVQLAESNAALMKAKYATIVTQKSIVDLLTKPAAQANTSAYTQSLSGPGQIGGSEQARKQALLQAQEDDVNYSVISVSQLQYKWAAVLGANGNLYSVMAGDVLPTDGSVVITIDKSGVILEKNGSRRKVSLVPII